MELNSSILRDEYNSKDSLNLHHSTMIPLYIMDFDIACIFQDYFPYNNYDVVIKLMKKKMNSYQRIELNRTELDEIRNTLGKKGKKKRGKNGTIKR